MRGLEILILGHEGGKREGQSITEEAQSNEEITKVIRLHHESILTIQRVVGKSMTSNRVENLAVRRRSAVVFFATISWFLRG